uniref:Pectinesterase inhibitor domain-containing protein n=1 Tax=Salix viminalis TaxID=40686 RepID=A0A6N2L969_SALVM
MPTPLSLFNLLFIFISFSTSPYSAAAKTRNAPQDLVRSSCVHASFPTSASALSPLMRACQHPRDLAQAAVKVSIARARRVSKYLDTLSGAKTKRERVALSDCVEQMWQMSNAQTWVSAALTNEDTCLDGFHEVESEVKDGVKRKITNVARVTSNALYLINRLDESRGRPKLGH